ncbi:hypothetical protein CI109_101649 [Kwoniella shandongensis]|uniref:Probable 26S proteasome regulatory subunit p27 n=1 Tax=Kwoniella shandongensis TaxID=1734106 RepID=A0A5M6C5Y2_9TREE|nr:uncharacterized protein CI109_001226 [Kwoniella shandongensis]KAA5530423.1 hypothetical protein CI109_001226 [Kwoniella shandongensis]
MDLVWPPPQPPADQPPAHTLPLPHPEAYPDEPREYARALMQRRDEIEKEIEALKDVLSSHGATPQTSLVDPEGYPRGDIDIYAIRHARSALVRLQNDRIEVTDRLGLALQNAFAPSSSSSAQPNGHSETVNGHKPASAAGEEPSWPERPVARVNTVASGSPAADAGLRPADLIYSFEGVTADSPGGIQAIGSVVARSEGTTLAILVLRQEERVTLSLTPRNGWGGRGMLGCHILPV